MLLAVLVNFINLFVLAFNLLILARVIMSWIMPIPSGAIGRFIFETTEPVLAPIRRILPKSQFIDLSPLVAYVLLQLLQSLVNRLI
jgi:YggT family protein